MSKAATAKGASEHECLRGGARTLGVSLDDRAIEQLLVFLDELERWNARSNLVGEHDRRVVLERHLIDSLAAAPVLSGLFPASRIADLGSGGGLPGVPLAIAVRPAETLLVEPRRKRASFLHAVRRALPELGLRIIERRADDLPEVEDASLDAIVSRAALTNAELLEAARPRLRPGGLLIAYRGERDPAEGKPEPAPGFSSPKSVPYELPGAHRRFKLLVWERFT